MSIPLTLCIVMQTIAGYNYGSIDSNQSHRICQAFQIVRFMKRHRPQFTIICGDFNAEPQSPTYNMIVSYGQLNDAWLETSGSESPEGHTCNLPENFYSPRNKRPSRIDYILYSTDKNESAVLKCQASEVTMGQIPGTELFYSDHSGVSAEFEFATREDTDGSMLANQGELFSIHPFICRSTNHRSSLYPVFL